LNGFYPIGVFTKILKQNGTMLFTSFFKDNNFILDIKSLFHADLLTEWKIESIKKVSRGFHIKLSEVADYDTAQFFIGEQFSLPEKELDGKSYDLLEGTTVFNVKGDEAGTIISISQTPSYLLAEIKNGDETYFIPLNDQFILNADGRIVVIKEPVNEN
jgi:ribosomal 30S subunit maturation factor RimM